MDDQAPERLLRTYTLTSAALANSAAVLAVAGGLLYGLIALGYDRFYRKLGIAPTDVGLTETRIVARTAIALAVFVAILAGVYVVVFAVLSWFLGRDTPPEPASTAPTSPEPEVTSPAAAPASRSVRAYLGVGGFLGVRDTATIALAAVAVLAVLGPVGLAFTLAPVLFDGPLARTTVTVMVVLAVAAAATIWLRRHAHNAARRRALRLVWIAVVAWLYVVTVQFASIRMASLADRVLAGQPIPDAGLTFVFDIHADPVCVREVTEPGSPGRPPFYALFLGQSGDWIAFYKPSESRTVRRTHEGLELSFIPATAPFSGSCT